MENDETGKNDQEKMELTFFEPITLSLASMYAYCTACNILSNLTENNISFDGFTDAHIEEMLGILNYIPDHLDSKDEQVLRDFDTQI